MRSLLVLLGLLLAASTAQAQQVSTTVAPETVAYGQDTVVTWRLAVQTGDFPLDARLELGPRTEPAQDAPSFEATHLDQQDVHLEGAGELLPGPVLISDPCHAFQPALPTYGARLTHGFEASAASFRLKLPANSETVVVVPVELSADAPWTYAMFALFVKLGEQEHFPPVAHSVGRRGVYLNLSTTPLAEWRVCGEWVRFPHDQPVTVRGDAHLPNGRIVDLVEYGPGTGEVRPVASVPVHNGEFRLDGWRPAPGEHVIGARHASQDPERTDDFSAPVWFAVEAPPPVEPPPPSVPARASPVPLRVGTVRVVDGRARVALRCPAGGEGCRGVLRLMRGDRRAAAARYEIAAGGLVRVRLRLPARDRRTLRRRGRLAAGLMFVPERGAPSTYQLTLRRR